MAWSPKNARRPAWWAAASLPKNNRRNRRERTRTGRKNLGRHDTQRMPSSEMPPPGTIMVRVRMMRHRRAPTVEHSGNANLGAKPLGIGGDHQRRLSRRREQQTVDRGFVVVGDIGDWTGQREHEMEIADGQQLGLALGEPFLGGGGLTLRAMPVAAAVVGNDSIGAVLAARDMAAKRYRAAALDG